MQSPLASRMLTLVTILLTFVTVAGQDRPSLSEIDRVRLAETFRVADSVGDRLWPGWSRAPFAVLLVTKDYEFLIRHPKPSAEFTKIEFDKRLNSDVYFRKRQFPNNLLATFPAISGSPVSTIVVGQAEHTQAKTSTPWVVILLHEHFHQLQDFQPNFYADVNALNLSGGDQSGMWMLNYPFPYERKEVQDQFDELGRLLSTAVKAPKPQRARRVREYRAARQKFNSMVTPADARYFSFQVWKEGIARYTEYHIAQLAATHHRPSKDFSALKDYQSFADVAKETRDRTLKQLTTLKLGEFRREVVYPFGAAEGLLLDQIRPGWRRKYFVEKFDLAELYDSRK